jgi:branched-chain amino acid transport system permease protein
MTEAQRAMLTRAAGLAALGVFLALFPLLHDWPVFGNFISDFRTFNMSQLAVWLLVVLSMNLLTGYSGQISIGHAAVVLTGAYTTGIFAEQYSVPLPLAIALAATITAVLGGVLIGVPAVRLSGPYLAIVTFALVISFPQILKIESLTHWTNGSLGIHVNAASPPGFIDNYLNAREWLYYVTMSVAVFMTLIYWNLTRSRIGRAFVAIRDSEIAAEQMGVNVSFYKALAFAISSLYAGIAGGLFVMVHSFVGPDSLGFTDSVLFLVAIVIGGLGTILGSVVGAIFLTFQVEAIGKLGFSPSLRNVIYGGLLVGFMLLFPRGLAGFIQGQAWRPREVWERLSARFATLQAAGRGIMRRPPRPGGRGGSST